jgi:hypothetical protein
VNGKVVGEERRLQRTIAVRGFDARSLQSGLFVRLVRPVRLSRSIRYDHVGVILFRPLDVIFLSRSGWGGWFVLGAQKFLVSDGSGAVRVWCREIRDVTGLTVMQPALAPRHLVQNEISRFSLSGEPHPFSEAEQRMQAGVDPWRSVACYSRLTVYETDYGSQCEEISLFAERVDLPDGGGLIKAVSGSRVLSWQDYRFWNGGVYEGAEVWASTERSSLQANEYVSSLGFKELGPEIPQDSSDAEGGQSFRWRVRIDQGVDLADVRAQLDRAEARLMTLDENSGVYWEPDGEELDGWYEWCLIGNSVEAVRAVVAAITREERLTLEGDVDSWKD